MSINVPKMIIDKISQSINEIPEQIVTYVSQHMPSLNGIKSKIF